MAIPPLPDKPKKTKEELVIKEIIDTEQTYNKRLGILIKFFSQLKSDKNLSSQFDEKELDEILTKIQSMKVISDSMLEDFRNLKEKTVSDIFKKYANQIKEVYFDYPTVFSKLNSTVAKFDDREKRRYEEFANQVEEFMGQGPAGDLISPIQRLPRYELLLKQLAESTDNEDERKTVEERLAGLKTIIGEINEEKRWKEYLEKLTGKNKADRLAAKTMTFTGNADLSRIKLPNAKEVSGVFSFEFVKKSFIRRKPDRINVYLNGGGKPYTFLIEANKDGGFSLTIEQDISKLNQKEVAKLFDIARKIGDSIMPGTKPPTPPYSLPEKNEPATQARTSQLLSFEDFQKLKSLLRKTGEPGNIAENLPVGDEQFQKRARVFLALPSPTEKQIEDMRKFAQERQAQLIPQPKAPAVAETDRSSSSPQTSSILFPQPMSVLGVRRTSASSTSSQQAPKPMIFSRPPTTIGAPKQEAAASLVRPLILVGERQLLEKLGYAGKVKEINGTASNEEPRISLSAYYDANLAYKADPSDSNAKRLLEAEAVLREKIDKPSPPEKPRPNSP